MSKNFAKVSESVDGVAVNYYGYQGDSNMQTSLNVATAALKTFNEMFGEYPYKTYSVVQADFVHGGMEYPNLVMISSSINNLDDYKNVIVHETAHQWWYGMVGNNEMNYPWLDEALTEFSTVLFYDYNEGYNFEHSSMINSAKDNYTLFLSVYQDVLGPIDTSMRGCNKYTTEPEYTYCIYVKGVLMFDSLYNLVGSKNFINSLKDYFETYKFNNATPENLISCFENNCKSNFDGFFSSWLNGKVVIR